MHIIYIYTVMFNRNICFVILKSLIFRNVTIMEINKNIRDKIIIRFLIIYSE